MDSIRGLSKVLLIDNLDYLLFWNGLPILLKRLQISYQLQQIKVVKNFVKTLSISAFDSLVCILFCH